MTITPSRAQIHITDKVLSMGSCFSAHIGQKMLRLKFQSVTNPFGILYHPIAIARGLDRLLEKRMIFSEELVTHGDLWHSWDFHGQFSAVDPEVALDQMNRSIESSSNHLETAQWLLLTFGTARGYYLSENKRFVANCHKFPGQLFERKLSTVEETTEILTQVLGRIKKQVQDLKVVLTVSPVRHIRDGLIENQESKAILILCCRALERKLGYVHYFPAYEIMMDELRDYRFYADDGTHPSQLAIEYIWETFQTVFFREEDRSILTEIEKVKQALAHRPLHPETKAHKSFLLSLEEKIIALQEKNPYLDFSDDLKKLSVQLAAD